MVPPPLYIGLRRLPLRLPPVPFCLCNFLLEPCTSARVLTLCVPWRCAARYCFTARYITCSFGSIPKISSGKSTVLPVFPPVVFKTSIVITLFLETVVHECKPALNYFWIKTIEPLWPGTDPLIRI